MMHACCFKISLITANHFNNRRKRTNTSHNLARYFHIIMHTRMNKNQIWAKLFCFNATHCRKNTKLSRFIRCSRNNTTWMITPNNHRFSTKTRIKQALNTHIKSIHIYVKNNRMFHIIFYFCSTIFFLHSCSTITY